MAHAKYIIDRDGAPIIAEKPLTRPSATLSPSDGEREGERGHTLFQRLPRIRPMRPNDANALASAAAEDDHIAVAPTHVVERAGEIVGYGSIGGMTYLGTWLHSQKVQARDSAYLLNLAENLAAMAGARILIMPCADNSPFAPHMTQLGYKSLGHAQWYLKHI